MPLRDRIFFPHTDGSDKATAYALAVLSHASYRTDPQYVTAWADAMGFTFRAVYQTPGVEIPNFVIVGKHPQYIVAIPGTNSLPQAVNNIIYSDQRENTAFGTGGIHSFFLWCAEGIVQFVQDNLADIGTGLELAFVGHSLGGAVAQLLADYVALNTGHTVKLCATYNAPRVGSKTWADAARSYPSLLHYCTHDMVVELPPSVPPNATALFFGDGIMSTFWHRSRLVPIESLRNIDESWFSIGISKVVYPAKWAIDLFSRARTAAMMTAALGYVGSRAAWASWVLPLPAWILEHSIGSVSDNLLATIRNDGFAEKNALRNVHTALNGTDSIFQQNANTNFALRPVANFAPGALPGNGTIADLPAIDPDTRYELVECATNWTLTPPNEPHSQFIDVNEAFFDAFAAAAPASPAGNPILSTTAPVMDFPARPHWLYRSTDRRILERLQLALEMIAARDLIVFEGTPSTRISVRDYVISPDDGDTLEAFYAVQEHIAGLLSTAIDPDA